MMQPVRDVAQNRLFGPTVKVKLDDKSPQAVCPLVLVCVSPSRVHGPLAELALNIWPGTISPTDIVQGRAPVGATSAVTLWPMLLPSRFALYASPCVTYGPMTLSLMASMGIDLSQPVVPPAGGPKPLLWSQWLQ